MKPKDSSFVERVTYCYGTMVVLFKNGTMYQYNHIPFKVFDDFRKAESAGHYFNVNIRGKFDGFKIEPTFISRTISWFSDLMEKIRS